MIRREGATVSMDRFKRVYTRKAKAKVFDGILFCTNQVHVGSDDCN